MIPNTLQNNMSAFAVKTSTLHNDCNGMLTGLTLPVKSTRPPFVTFLALAELISSTTKTPTQSCYVVWQDSLSLVATNQAPHMQKRTPFSWLSTTRIGPYTPIMSEYVTQCIRAYKAT